jgi:hypothetical protein
MQNNAYKYALLSQASLLGGILICVVIRFKEAVKNVPISYFGNFHNTILPYAAGFLLCVYWLLRTVHLLPSSMRGVRALLLCVAACALGVLCTPYMVSKTIGAFHLSFAILLLVLEIILSIILISRLRRLLTVVGFLIQLVGAILSGVSQLGIVHVELIGELLTIIGFGMMLTFNLRETGKRLSIESSEV